MVVNVVIAQRVLLVVAFLSFALPPVVMIFVPKILLYALV
uniref:NADH dehydrogenase subunit 1 n=1 Tax=Acrobeloides nanus TaxID=290746 RepID=A0A914CVK5_9BILA